MDEETTAQVQDAPVVEETVTQDAVDDNAPLLAQSREDKMRNVIDRYNDTSPSDEGAETDGESLLSYEYGELEPGEEPAPESVAAADVALPEGLRRNDAGDWVQVLRIDGVDVERPYDDYRAQAQSYVAGSNRLREGVELQKNMRAQQEKLSAWEQSLREKEAQMTQKFVDDKASLPPATGAVSDATVSDESITEEARAIVGPLFAGDESQAIESVAGLIRATRQPTAPPVDTDVLTQEAARIALQSVEQREQAQLESQRTQEAATAYRQFQQDYPELVADANLFKLADAETEIVAALHPEWGVGQVMSEAGKKITERLDAHRQPTIETSQPASQRSQNKANLQPIPSVRSGATQAAPQTKADVVMTPQSVIAGMRSQRGGLRNEI